MRKLQFHFRFDVEQDDARTITCSIPDDGSTPLLNPAATKLFNLSDGEIDAAETAVLREIAIVKG